MKTEFETIDLFTLVLVNGGQDTGGQNAVEAEGNVGLTLPTTAGEVQVGLQGKLNLSNYAKCVDTIAAMPGAKPADLANCLPLRGGE